MRRLTSLSHIRGLSGFTLFPSLVAVTLLTGCGDRDGGMRVWGEVTYDSRPVPEGTILLMPGPGQDVPAAGALITNGRYDIPAKKGPRAGVTYTVSIEGLEKTGRTIRTPMGTEEDEKREFIPSEYNVRSTLQITVSKKASENRNDLILEKPGKPKP